MCVFAYVLHVLIGGWMERIEYRDFIYVCGSVFVCVCAFPLSHLTSPGKSNCRLSLDSSSHEEMFNTALISFISPQLTSNWAIKLCVRHIRLYIYVWVCVREI